MVNHLLPHEKTPLHNSSYPHFENERLIPVVPSSGSVFYTVSKRKEMVMCMGSRNGTIGSKQALSQCRLMRFRDHQG